MSAHRCSRIGSVSTLRAVHQQWFRAAPMEERIHHFHFQSKDSTSRLRIFIARQHTDARYWYSNCVRLSVRPLRSGILWQRLNIILHHTVAQSLTYWQNSDGVTPAGTLNTGEVIIFRFSTISCKRYRHKTNRKPHPSFQMVQFSMTLNGT